MVFAAEWCMVRGLRLLLLLDAAGMLVASSITDPIIGDVALAPLLSSRCWAASPA